MLKLLRHLIRQLLPHRPSEREVHTQYFPYRLVWTRIDGALHVHCPECHSHYKGTLVPAEGSRATYDFYSRMANFVCRVSTRDLGVNGDLRDELDLLCRQGQGTLFGFVDFERRQRCPLCGAAIPTNEIEPDVRPTDIYQIAPVLTDASGTLLEDLEEWVEARPLSAPRWSARDGPYPFRLIRWNGKCRQGVLVKCGACHSRWQLGDPGGGFLPRAFFYSRFGNMIVSREWYGQNPADTREMEFLRRAGGARLLREYPALPTGMTHPCPLCGEIAEHTVVETHTARLWRFD